MGHIQVEKHYPDHAKQRTDTFRHRELPRPGRLPGRTRTVVRAHRLFAGRRRQTPAADAADARPRHLLRRHAAGAARSRGGRGVPQLHAAARRHHGQRRRAARQTLGLCQMGPERGHPLGRRHADLRLPPAEHRSGETAAAGAGDVQRHGPRSVRGTAVRHGFRAEGQGLGRGVHAHDRVEDLGAAGRSRGDRRHAGRRLRGGLPQTAPLRRRTGARLPVAGRPAGQLRRRAAGQGHRGRHPRREENLPDGHGHEPRGRSQRAKYCARPAAIRSSAAPRRSPP